MSARMIRALHLALAGLALVQCGPSDAFKEDYERFQSVRVGMTEEEVRARLGAPMHEYDKASAPTDYYVQGWLGRRGPSPTGF